MQWSGDVTCSPSGAGKGPSFQTRPGAPVDADLVKALEVLSARAAPQKAGELTDHEQQPREEESTRPAVEGKSGDEAYKMLRAYACHQTLFCFLFSRE